MSRFQKLLKYLRKHYKFKVSIRHMQDDKHAGLCSYDTDGNLYLIEIDSDSLESVKLETLIHEYAHALRHKRHKSFCNKLGEYHDDKYGICYAEVYRVYEKWCEEFRKQWEISNE